MCRRQRGEVRVQDFGGDVAASCYVGGWILCSALLVRERAAVIDTYVDGADMAEWLGAFTSEWGQPYVEVFGGVRHYFWTEGAMRIGLSLAERGVRVRAASIAELQQR